MILEHDETSNELKFPVSKNNNSDSVISLKEKLQKMKEKLQKLKKHDVVKKSNDFKTEQNTNKISALCKFLLSNDNIETHFTYYGRTKFRVLLKTFQMILKAKWRKSFLDKNSIYHLDDKQKFVYFPLHQDEEHATLIQSTIVDYFLSQRIKPKMKNEDGSPNTSHTTNPVPIILVDRNKRNVKNGILSDIAPTVLEILGIEKPLEMTGNSLIKK